MITEFFGKLKWFDWRGVAVKQCFGTQVNLER
jgi:hypothetical protein